MTVEVQGHRIAGRLAPENSLDAIAVASRLGYHSVEFDVRSTKDGVLVVSHGPESEKFPQGIVAEELLWDELRALPLPGGVQMPTLLEVVVACLAGGLFMNVEIKPGHADSVAEVLDLLERCGARDRFVISSFDRAVLERVFQCDPTVGVGALYDDSQVEATPEDFATWFPPPGRPSHPLDSVNLCQESVTEEEIDAAHAAGKRVLLWFPGIPNKAEYDDSADRLRHLISLGVDCVCTNRPDLLLQETRPKLPRISSHL